MYGYNKMQQLNNPSSAQKYGTYREGSWNISHVTMINNLDIIHGPDLYIRRRFGDWTTLMLK
jgi:hypothetical protein